jgi:putative membrane protein
MGIFTSLKNELLGILHNRKLLIAVIGVMTVPLLYSGTYLWAFWDPYGHLDRLPVAVVNNDQGAVYNGSKLEIGKDLVKELKKKESFQWKFVSEKEADKGLKNQNYYIKVEIPKDFSEDATTLQSENPKKLTLIYTPNEGYNYLSSKIGDSAIEKIKEEVSSSVTKTYAQSMLQNIKDVANGLAKAGDGAASLNDGTVQVDSGAKKLEENLKTLAAVMYTKRVQMVGNRFEDNWGPASYGLLEAMEPARYI